MSRNVQGGFKRSRHNFNQIQSSEKEYTKEYAVALEYKEEWGSDAAPKIIAKGQGEVASRIIESALDNEILIQRNNDLVSLLYASEIGDEIPIDAFIVVAEIISYIYQKNDKI